jgi:predicted aldo/keto reductase-like oxidoreductase
MKGITRRGFLKTGIAGAGAMALTPSVLSAATSIQENNIVYRTLGKTGLKVPVISFGVMRSDSASLCKAALEKGIKLFDTANGYQGGNNETMLGNFFKSYPRDSFLLATKVKPTTANDGKPNDQTSADKFLEMFSTSLSRLQMDYVDILYVHDIRHTDMLDHKPIINAVNNLKKQGKVKYVGFSTHSNEAEVINAAAELKTFDVILTQYNYRLAYLNELNSAIKKAAAAGIGIVAMKTVAGGGFLDRERTKPMNTSAAIKWVLSNPDIHTTIPGMTSFDQLEINSKILADISMNDQEKQDLLAASSESGLFCKGCKECLLSCPKNLPVPDLMRAYMYAYGYSMPSMAQTLLADLGISSDPCSDCNECSVKCTNRFDLKEKIADISRLATVPADFLA